MTKEEVSKAVCEGLIPNEVHKFQTQAIKEVGRKRQCPTSSRRAWELFCESLKDVTFPAKKGV